MISVDINHDHDSVKLQKQKALQFTCNGVRQIGTYCSLVIEESDNNLPKTDPEPRAILAANKTIISGRKCRNLFCHNQESQKQKWLQLSSFYNDKHNFLKPQLLSIPNGQSIPLTL